MIREVEIIRLRLILREELKGWIPPRLLGKVSKEVNEAIDAWAKEVK